MSCKVSYNQEFKVFVPEFAPSIKMNYLLGLPKDYSPEESLPMIVFLHGAGERGTDPRKIKVHGIPKRLDNGLPVRAIILAPQVPDERHVWNTLMDEAMELIEKIAVEYNADKNRISLTGISMGGYGTWEIGTSNDKFFSALAPICGGGMSWRGSILKDVPIRAFHGDADDVVPVQTTLEMVDNINDHGGKAECIILHRVGHGSWDYAYNETNLMEWLVSQTKEGR